MEKYNEFRVESQSVLSHPTLYCTEENMSNKFFIKFPVLPLEDTIRTILYVIILIK